MFDIEISLCPFPSATFNTFSLLFTFSVLVITYPGSFFSVPLYVMFCMPLTSL